MPRLAPALAVRELLRVLAPGGRLALTWWTDVLDGTCVNAAVITRQERATIERIKDAYHRIVAEYRLPDGQVDLTAGDAA